MCMAEGHLLLTLTLLSCAFVWKAVICIRRAKRIARSTAITVSHQAEAALWRRVAPQMYKACVAGNAC